MKIYYDNIQQYKAAVAALEKELNNISMLRLAVFIGSAILLTVLANERMLGVVLLVAPLCVVGFGMLVNRYNEVERLKQRSTFLQEINEAEILRHENKLSGFAGGETFITRDHAYVSDLDVFGAHSLYQLINRTTTDSAHALLAEWLSAPAPRAIILERQQAVKELSPVLEWRQNFQATGMHFRHAKGDYNKLLLWIEQPVQILPHRAKWLSVIIPLSMLSTAAAVYFVAVFMLQSDPAGIFPLAIALLVNGLVLRRVKPMAEGISENITQNIKLVGGYHSLMVAISTKAFHTPLLQRLQSALKHDYYSAAGEISKLKKILELFQNRGAKKAAIGRNFFYTVVNLLWFIDVHLIFRMEKWRSKNGSSLRAWAAAISEFEVLSSVAGFQYSNPAYTFPEINERPYSIRFEMLGHPLIGAEHRVSNNFILEGRGEIAMITGSNMAGKSTFLRTAGINLVLAFMGAPCCARAGQISEMKLFTSMRTQDNLEEGVSSFYAELKRVQQLLKLIEHGEPIFFLLDEMFKGTNSKDRHKGGFSLITQLKALNAFGMISTHDLDLAILAGKHRIVTNYSFNSEIREGEMFFNYELTPGLCKDFNASELMKRSGIKILSEIEEG
jgi:hypothetical protein